MSLSNNVIALYTSALQVHAYKLNGRKLIRPLIVPKLVALSVDGPYLSYITTQG